MTQHTVLGFLSALIAAVLFGSAFVVVKQYDMGDGIHWQLCNALGIWLVGLVTVLCKSVVNGSGTYLFHPIALSTGVIWSVGNMLTVPILKTIGLALGMAIWCATQLVVGWSTGKWGLLGTPKDESVKIEALNYIAVILVIISLLLFFQVKPDTAASQDNRLQHENLIVQHDKLDEPICDDANAKDKNSGQKSQTWLDDLSTAQQKILGVSCSILAGLCYGVMFCPIQSVVQNEARNGEYSQDLIDYVFEVYNGIFISSLVCFFVYSACTKNDPFVNRKAMMPSIAGGVVWAIAMNAYFVAIDEHNLGVETTFPIISAGPQIISSLWGVLYYKEVKGNRNIIYLSAAIGCSLISVAFVSLSKF